ncbi:DUF4158 domain-containing protein [Marinactinospora thermotolerans]|uniref:DUF4158 domain-containing protein n=1 Tax=Marinactinospora thermotolerans TaxID=531310 RepID=UPI003D9151AC
MPVEFLSDEQAAAFASFQGAPTRDELGKYFFLDDVDRQRAASKRRDHNKLGFGVQIGVVRYLRRHLPDPRQVLAEVVDYVAEQLQIADPSCIKLYGQRDGTAHTHAGERSRRPTGGRTSPKPLATWRSGCSPAPTPPGRGPRRCSTPR